MYKVWLKVDKACSSHARI